MRAKTQSRLGGALFFVAVTLVCPAQQSSVESAEPVFQSQSRLVLLPFRVVQHKSFVTNLRQSDVVLLEDGKPRAFTIFDTPTSQARLPVELVLLFDTTPKIPILWDPSDVFRFVSQWDDGLSGEILQKAREQQAEVRISVYQSFGETLYRMSPATVDAHAVTNALRSVLLPIPSPPAPGAMIELKLPARRDRVGLGPFTEDYPTSYFIGAEGRGWTMEAAIGLLNEVSAAQDRVARVLVMFSEGIGATTTVPDDIGNQALDLGIPIYPVATNYRNNISGDYPRNLFRMRQFKALGKMTGGRAAEYSSINARTLRAILGGVISDSLAQYVVGFVPDAEEHNARRHQLEIRLASKSAGTVEGGKRRAFYQ